MRWLAAVIIGVCVTGAAIAQDNDTPIVFTPSWEVQPTPADYVRNYPPRALQENVSGIAVLCCIPRADRGLDCAVNSEWPEGRGFGDASVRTAQAYRLSAETHRDLSVRNNPPLRVSVIWAGPVLGPGVQDDLMRRDRDSAFVCMPAQNE